MNSPSLPEHIIMDTRFLSCQKVYINEISNAIDLNNVNDQNAENSTKKSVIRVNNSYCGKVNIMGLIVGIYECEKYYRLKIGLKFILNTM